MTREEKLKLIYRHTHRDFKGKNAAGERSILIYRRGTCLVPLSALTDEEIADRIVSALEDEERRKAAKSPAA